MGLPPQLELLDVFSRFSGHNKMSKQCNHIQRSYEQSYSGMDTQTHCALISFYSSYTKQSAAGGSWWPVSQSNDCRAKGMGWLGITSKAVVKKVTPLTNNTAWCKLISCVCVCAWACVCPRKASFLSLVWGGSTANSAEVKIQWIQRDVQNNDKWWLGVFCFTRF